MSSTVEQVKDRLSIEEVVSQYVKLIPAGQNLKARCPFHGERTPSFMVSPTRQTYHCFGCSVGGDIFSFIEMIEGVDFKGALKILADKAGVEIKYNTNQKENGDKKEILLAIIETATNFFIENLKNNKGAKKYLIERGLKDETIKEFKVGFSKDSWGDLLSYLKSKKFEEKDIEKTGLIIKSEKRGGYYDRFRSRIMFPIADNAGRIVAFSARHFHGEHPLKPEIRSEEATAKYINSPETLLYNKSRILYGYDRARQAVRRNDFAILVEGQMDLLASHQSGYPNTVAISGTALTVEHVTLLSRMSKNLVLALDSDEAGLASVARSAKIALQKGFDVKVAEMPENSDPADIISQDTGEKEWKKIIRNSKHIIEFLLDVYKEKSQDDRKFKQVVEREVLPYIGLIQSSIDREHFANLIAARLGTSLESIKDSIVLSDNKTLEDMESEKNMPSRSKFTTLLEKLLSIYLWKQDKSLKKNIEGIVGEDEFSKVEENLIGRDGLKFVLEDMYEDEDKLQSDVAIFLDYLQGNVLQEKLIQATASMRMAEASKDEEKAAKYMNECNNLHKQLAKLGGV